MDSITFFKGVEVGRALRGWRTPDEQKEPIGTKVITKNGLYDDADYATANVNVTVRDEADAAQIRAAMQYEWFSFAVFAQDPAFTVRLMFVDVDEDEDGYATTARWRLLISTMTGAFNQDDYLAYIMTPDEFTIPGNENAAVPTPLISGIGRHIAGTHTLTFTRGLTGADASQYQINIESRQLPNVTGGAFIGALSQSDTSYAVKCYGDGWADYSDPWAGYFDFETQL